MVVQLYVHEASLAGLNVPNPLEFLGVTNGHISYRSLCLQLNGSTMYEFAPACELGAKLAGVHWWHKSRAHAAELTAGYYNTRERDGYAPLMQLLARHSARVSFTCVEMRDCEHPPEGRCSPQGAPALP